MAKIHLIEGPVGAGKSTYATRLAAELGAPRLDLDDWFVTLFSPDRPADGFLDWYLDRKQRCLEQIWHVTEAILDVDPHVVLELGLVGRADRAGFYARVDAADHDLEVHLLDEPADVRRERVRARNRSHGATFKMAVPDEIFELADRAWEPPDDAEISARRIRLVRSRR
jgi:predicted kinase